MGVEAVIGVLEHRILVHLLVGPGIGGSRRGFSQRGLEYGRDRGQRGGAQHALARSAQKFTASLFNGFHAKKTSLLYWDNVPLMIVQLV